MVNSRTELPKQLYRTPSVVVLSMAVSVAFTREAGANGKVMNLLPELNCLELPCIMFGDGPDTDKLDEAIPSHDVIVVTSPQAAKVFVSSWKRLDKPDVKAVTVGKGTSEHLINAGIHPLFEPSDSTARTLAAELPTNLGSSILYPSSALADNKLVDGLRARGFQVSRLNTYTTVPSVWTPDQLEVARSVDIVAFASPSAIQTWVERAGNTAIAICIGPTSEAAAKKAGFRKVHSPSEGSKGVQPWAELIRSVAVGTLKAV